jgi:hypothetical protein
LTLFAGGELGGEVIESVVMLCKESLESST